nr:hypothetical protein [Tanacetum cinerariifolium]
RYCSFILRNYNTCQSKNGPSTSDGVQDGVQKSKKAKTDSYSDEILRITRTDFELTCYKLKSNTVLWYQRISSFDISKVGRDAGGLLEKNDEHNLLTPPRAILHGQSDDEAAKKTITTLSLLCNKNLNVLKVYGGDVKIDHDCYRVAIEKRGTCLHDFMKSSHDHKKLKLLSGIVTGLLGLHDNVIFLGNLDISDIVVDKEHSIAKISVISEKTRFPLISSSEGATDDMLADMLALGHIIFFILAGVEYKNKDLTKQKPSNDNLKPIYGDPEALDLLRKLLHEVPALRSSSLLDPSSG